MSTEAKFTPGPWDVRKLQDHYEVMQGKDVLYLIASVNDYGPENNGANASLIAAAPVLYEALERMKAKYTDLLKFYDSEAGDYTAHYTAAIDDADAALASARGEG